MSEDSANRRAFLSGKMMGDGLARAGDEFADQIISKSHPVGGDTLRLTTRAMACEFSVILNPGCHDRVMDASDALELVHQLEAQLSVYREDSEISVLNRTAETQPANVDPKLYELLKRSNQIYTQTHGCFDLSSAPLINLWKRCRSENRVPSQDEIDATLESVGMHQIAFDDNAKTIQFGHANTALDLGGIGKGYALDQAGQKLKEQHVDGWLLHGGHSSLLAFGEHNQTEGWPVGIGNPLFREKRLGTLVLRNQAMSTSGSNVQFFRHAGKRYGHILDPRNGLPVEGALSVTVVAPNAELADALSTAFYVMRPDEVRNFCDSHPKIGAILTPFPKGDRRVTPEVLGIPHEQIFWDESQIVRR